MSSSISDKIKGVANEAVGKVRQGVGSATGNEALRAKGAVQEGKGAARPKLPRKLQRAVLLHVDIDHRDADVLSGDFSIGFVKAPRRDDVAQAPSPQRAGNADENCGVFIADQHQHRPFPPERFAPEASARYAFVSSASLHPFAFFLVAAALSADAERSQTGREADASPPRTPPRCAAEFPVVFPRPEPPGFLPPPSSLLTVAQARRAASSAGTPRFS